MPEQSDLDRRLRAVERALTDGDHDVAALEDAAAMVERLDALEERITDLEERTGELDAATQAVRGYVGNVRSVNESVEDRADAALAAVDRIERRLDAFDDQSRPSACGDTALETRAHQESLRSDQHAPDSDTKAATTTGRSPTPSGKGDARGPGSDAFGIEMPAHDASSTADRSTDSHEDERSVIDRVREAL